MNQKRDSTRNSTLTTNKRIGSSKKIGSRSGSGDGAPNYSSTTTETEITKPTTTNRVLMSKNGILVMSATRGGKKGQHKGQKHYNKQDECCQ